mmetsp:Transcript_26816/g.58309  ORF Transcript_26816/g.58309 Transcript_26816/m.58309 type:complete len:85 (+) Transcript_26816:37-291(+)
MGRTQEAAPEAMWAVFWMYLQSGSKSFFVIQFEVFAWMRRGNFATKLSATREARMVSWKLFRSLIIRLFSRNSGWSRSSGILLM